MIGHIISWMTMISIKVNCFGLTKGGSKCDNKETDMQIQNELVYKRIGNICACGRDT